MSKKLVYILVIVILLAAGWLIKQELDKQAKPASSQPAFKAEPTFLTGTISRLENDKVYFTVSVPNLDSKGKQIVSYEDRIARVSAQTKIVFQGSSKDKLTDLKAGMLVAVYYYPENALKGEILAEKIQVIK